MTKLGRPISCECLLDTCKTCYNRTRRRAWVAKNQQREREQNAEHQRAYVDRIKADSKALKDHRAKRREANRRYYAAKREQLQTEAAATRTLTITDLGEDRLYSFAEWIATFGPIGSHGNYFHPLIR
jgi:hypothetical protein